MQRILEGCYCDFLATSLEGKLCRSILLIKQLVTKMKAQNAFSRCNSCFCCNIHCNCSKWVDQGRRFLAGTRLPFHGRILPIPIWLYVNDVLLKYRFHVKSVPKKLKEYVNSLYKTVTLDISTVLRTDGNIDLLRQTFLLDMIVHNPNSHYSIHAILYLFTK